MPLPFSHGQFLDVFGAYNAALWPFAVLLWIGTAGVAAAWLSGRPVSARLLLGLLAVHWAWSAIAYHWAFFRSINPSAALFAAVFALQAIGFAWLAARGRGDFAAPRGLRGMIGAAFVVYGLAYPLIGIALGLRYPRMPIFGVPCPTTLVTAGWLIASTGLPRIASAIPILWALVASSAAFALGIRADLALIPAAFVLAIDLITPKAPR